MTYLLTSIVEVLEGHDRKADPTVSIIAGLPRVVSKRTTRAPLALFGPDRITGRAPRLSGVIYLGARPS